MSEAATAESEPLIIMVAPNGARRGKADHPALPITPAEIAREAAACREAGASMIHLHVRDAQGRHTLSPVAYRAAIEVIAASVGDGLVIQVTSEAVGRYAPAEQMAMVREVKPECVSLALREIVPDESHEGDAAAFLEWLRRERIVPQYILYSPADISRYRDLCRRGIVPGKCHFLLFVLGRYSADQQSAPADLLPFLAAAEAYGVGAAGSRWAMCAFGAREGACAAAAAAFGGDARVGFENNFHLADGSVAADNAALVAQLSDLAPLMHRHVVDAGQARNLLAELAR